MKIAQRISSDDEIMSRVDGMLIKALDLEHHPEHAETNAVIISCGVEYTDTSKAASHIMHLLSGREPPPVPDMVPHLFQINTIALLENELVPDTLNVTAERSKGLFREAGLLQPGSGQILVRAAWVSTKCPWATCYFARCITPEMIQEASAWKRPVEEDEPPCDEPMTTEDLIK